MPRGKSPLAAVNPKKSSEENKSNHLLFEKPKIIGIVPVTTALASAEVHRWRGGGVPLKLSTGQYRTSSGESHVRFPQRNSQPPIPTLTTISHLEIIFFKFDFSISLSIYASWVTCFCVSCVDSTKRTELVQHLRFGIHSAYA